MEPPIHEVEPRVSSSAGEVFMDVAPGPVFTPAGARLTASALLRAADQAERDKAFL